jgi:hypothetical protein
MISLLLIIQCTSKDRGHESNVIARIGEETISVADLDLAIKAIPTPYRYEYKSEKAVHDLVENMIDWKLMAKEAVKIGLDRESNIQAQLGKASDFSENKGEQILADAYLQIRLAQAENITEEEISDYYLSHQEEFKIPESVRIKRIFLKTEADAKMSQEELEKGMSFEELIERSHNLSNKVDTLWLHRRDGNSEMEKIAFNLIIPCSLLQGYALIIIERVIASNAKQSFTVRLPRRYYSETAASLRSSQ